MIGLVACLFLLGIVLLAVEVIVPGGIVGLIGGAFLFAGCVVAWTQLGPLEGSAAVAIAFLAGIAAFYVEFRILPKTKWGRRAFLTRQITAVSAPVEPGAKALVGQPAEALTVLSPSGWVRVDGRRFEAFCRTGHVTAGTQLEVVDADNFRLIVTPTHYANP